MFDFEKWSEEVYRLIDLIQEDEGNSENVSHYKEELKELWDEMLQQDNDMFVQFLKDLLNGTKDVLDGTKDQEELETVVNRMRENVLG